MVVFVLCMGAALVLLGWEDAVRVARQVTPWHLMALCALAGLHYLIRAMRWHLLVRAQGVPCSLSQNLLHFFGGFAMTATPGRLGELVRLRWLKRASAVSLTRLLPVALADRTVELASLLLLVLSALAFGSLGSGAVWALIGVTTVLVMIFCRPVLLEALLVWLWKAIGRRSPRTFARIRRVIRDLHMIMHSRILLPILLIGIFGWALEGVAFWLLLDWLDVTLPLATATAIFMVAILAGALSGLPGGFGGTEATGVGLLMLQGVPAESAVVAIVLIRLVTFWFAVLIGLIAFPFAESLSEPPPQTV